MFFIFLNAPEKYPNQKLARPEFKKKIESKRKENIINMPHKNCLHKNTFLTLINRT